MRGAPFYHGREEDLGDYGAEFAEARAEAVAGAADAGGKDFGGGDEGCCIGA